MADKINLTDVIIAGFRNDHPDSAVFAVKQNLNQNWTETDGGLKYLTARLDERLANKSIEPKMALNVIDFYAYAASRLGHPGAFKAADEAFQTYEQKVTG